MTTIIIKPKNKTELNLLKGLFKKMELNIEVIKKKKNKYTKKSERPYALCKDKITIDDSFNDALPEDLLSKFYE